MKRFRRARPPLALDKIADDPRVFYSAANLQERLGRGQATIWRYAKTGGPFSVPFPKPITLGTGIAGWTGAQLHEWWRELMAAA